MPKLVELQSPAARSIQNGLMGRGMFYLGFFTALVLITIAGFFSTFGIRRLVRAIKASRGRSRTVFWRLILEEYDMIIQLIETQQWRFKLQWELAFLCCIVPAEGLYLIIGYKKMSLLIAKLCALAIFMFPYFVVSFLCDQVKFGERSLKAMEALTYINYAVSLIGEMGYIVLAGNVSQINSLSVFYYSFVTSSFFIYQLVHLLLFIQCFGFFIIDEVFVDVYCDCDMYNVQNWQDKEMEAQHNSIRNVTMKSNMIL